MILATAHYTRWNGQSPFCNVVLSLSLARVGLEWKDANEPTTYSTYRTTVTIPYWSMFAYHPQCRLTKWMHPTQRALVSRHPQDISDLPEAACRIVAPDQDGKERACNRPLLLANVAGYEVQYKYSTRPQSNAVDNISLLCCAVAVPHPFHRASLR